VQETDMNTATPLIAAIALLALSACGDEASTSAEAPADSPKTERVAEAASAAPAMKSGEVAEVTVKAPTKMPEPDNPIIAFESEDGKLSLGRNALTMVSPVHDAENDVWSVFVQLDKQAAEDFYTLTTEIAGEALAVVVDDMTVSTPVLETAVYGGGFVFRVDDGEVASTVIAALKGEKRTEIVEVSAEDALPEGGEAEDTVASADAEES